MIFRIFFIWLGSCTLCFAQPHEENAFSCWTGLSFYPVVKYGAVPVMVQYNISPAIGIYAGPDFFLKPLDTDGLFDLSSFHFAGFNAGIKTAPVKTARSLFFLVNFHYADLKLVNPGFPFPQMNYEFIDLTVGSGIKHFLNNHFFLQGATEFGGHISFISPGFTGQDVSAKATFSIGWEF